MALTFLSDHLSADLTILPSRCSTNVGFAQFRKFDLKFETEIIIRLKCWNFSFCGLFFFFLPVPSDSAQSLISKLDSAKFTEEILENIAIATSAHIPKVTLN